MAHHSGFVNIIGNPNVGKSSLLNEFVGEKLAIINAKAQTTRHRIFGIYNDEEYQIVFSDLPGVIKPAYKMQESMMGFVKEALQDADLFLFMAELGEREFKDERILQKLQEAEEPLYVVVNKIDLGNQAALDAEMAYWAEIFPKAKKIFPISVTEKFNVQELFRSIKSEIPEGPEWFPKDQLSDKNDRFIISEIVREKILTNFQQEIPYSVEVVVEGFQEEPDIIRARAVIIVARDSQKNIIIGKGGSMIKKFGTQARKSMEAYYGKKVFLETFVKVDKDWRNDDRKLKKYGY
ncbi:GTPase Era [Salibacteraceae bacterium]|jgi:GTPase|nr:GTPase Era [Salibacteraceae bacterium]MDB9709624.1 GTPase Era [Salibacteraceae bacterium]HAQ71782.1 GTPase Era [Flavobacteriales bacterium]